MHSFDCLYFGYKSIKRSYLVACENKTDLYAIQYFTKCGTKFVDLVYCHRNMGLVPKARVWTVHLSKIIQMNLLLRSFIPGLVFRFTSLSPCPWLLNYTSSNEQLIWRLRPEFPYVQTEKYDWAILCWTLLQIWTNPVIGWMIILETWFTSPKLMRE